MNYYYDCEFLEGKQRLRKTFWEALFAFKKETVPTIDMISIGIVADDGREYYAVSKDFNLNEAWNRYDIKYVNDGQGGRNQKVYWIRENVLYPIYRELYMKETGITTPDVINNLNYIFSDFKYYIEKYGKTNDQIAKEVEKFCTRTYCGTDLYGYYPAYDHVVLMWLFGKMLNRPKGFPMFTNDLKQMLDQKLKCIYLPAVGIQTNPNYNLESKLKEVKMYKSYPKQSNAHNALDDARWNKRLHDFIKTL